MEELKYHYSNPKFDGLPWPADQKSRIGKVKCVKKPYAEFEAQEEAKEMRKECPESLWVVRLCESCGVYHVYRE